jgi:2'-5' RNA ligase
VACRWWVDEVCLVRSHLASTGARYETLMSIPLA